MRRNVNFSDIGERLTAVRNKLNLKQKDMAAVLKMPASYLSEIERGKGNPGPEFFIKLASEFKISMDYLILGIGDMFLPSEGKVKRKEFNFSHGIKTLEELAWLMDESFYFNSMVLATVNKILINDEEVIIKGIRKKSEQRQLDEKEKGKDTSKRDNAVIIKTKSKI